MFTRVESIECVRSARLQATMPAGYDADNTNLIASRKPRIVRSNEHRIKRTLFRNYDKTTRPVVDDNAPVEVDVAISLYHILDTNEKEQTFTCLLAIRQRWHDEYLVWNKTEFGGVESIRVPANTIWTPDLVISNFAGDKFNDYMVTNTIVSYDGLVLWLFPALIKTYCMLNVKYFPFDTQHCDIVFISWTHSGHQLDVIYNDSFPTSIYYNSENQEWLVDNISAERHEKKYACCPELYPDVTFTIHMRRGSLFYVVNLISPCLLIFFISFLGFFLPVESGEKVSLETTILLALVVFLLMVGETMPPTPDSIPILGMFFASTMVMVSIALVMAVIVTNIYAKKDTPVRCPRWTVRLASRFYPAHFLPRSHHVDRPQIIERLTAGGVTKPLPSTRSDGPHQQACRQHGYRNSSPQQRASDVSASARDNNDDDVICTCCLCHGDGEVMLSLSSRQPGVPASVAVTTPSRDVPFDYERSQAEWRMVAKFTDRVFFWLFLSMSLLTHSNLFLQMVPETRPVVVGG